MMHNDRGAYASGVLDGAAVTADLRARVIDDAYTGVWDMDENGDVMRTFEVVRCRPEASSTRPSSASAPSAT